MLESIMEMIQKRSKLQKSLSIYRLRGVSMGLSAERRSLKGDRERIFTFLASMLRNRDLF